MSRRGAISRRVTLAGAVIVAITLASIGLLRAGAGAAPARARAVRAPVIGRAVSIDGPGIDDVGDPFVLTVTPAESGDAKPYYVLYWTTDWQSNVPTAVSTDLRHWHRVADSLPVLPSWATPSRTLTWGPTVARIGDRWVLYFSTQDAATGRECVGRAVSASPTGPFTDASSGPLVCQAALGGDIDPSVVTGAGVTHLVWKNNGNADRAPVDMWEQALTRNGLAVTGSPRRLLGANQHWEHGIVEGPAMLADTSGGWWLTYSGGYWQSDTYGTGVAHCRTIGGPCVPVGRGPLIASRRGVVSPGGLDTFVDASGRLWASYSAFPYAPSGAGAGMAAPRLLQLAPILSH